ncbi:MAG: EamA family transporter [Phycisphaerales bacterium JB040]
MAAIVFAVLAGLAWGIGEVFTKGVLHSRQIGPITAIAVRSTVALPLIWGAWALWVGLLRREPVRFWQADGAVLWKLALGSGVTAGACAMICFYLALSFGEVSRVKPIAFALAPAVAVLLGVLALGESWEARKLLGVALILVGVVVLAGAPRKATGPDRPAQSTAPGDAAHAPGASS